RKAIRRVLSVETGLPPGALDLVSGVDGKPELAGADPQIHFNISHSGELILLGVCREARLGVDIELIAPIEKALVDQFFSRAEQQALAREPEDRWLNAFYRCWTRKEALLKALGKGLKLPLNQFDVSIGETPRLLRAELTDPRAWSLQAVDVPASYEAVVAVEARGRPVEVCLRPAHEAEPAAPIPAPPSRPERS
ncbi:MAG: 4'-phosphopantetheinyl transferase superfamily protein, partial [Henriciella sp.]|uniref:4'-phosphopantetheinyl transferase family protein n=1 Tax=Henriciella sp. TaxID=1968823 RepID=UPI003C76D3CF